MDIASISSLTSAQTRLMLANVKTRTAETAENEQKTSSSASDTTTAAKTETKPAESSAASTATSTDTSSTTSDATKIAELEAKLENGQALTSEEIKYLDKVSPGTYEKIMKQRTEQSDYIKALTATTSDTDAASVHMNKLSDLLTETKSIANDSSLSDDEKIAMYQDITSRLNSVENITSTFSSGNADAQDSIAAFQSLLSATSNASQQTVMLRYNKSLASEMLNSTEETEEETASASSAAKSSATSKTAATASTVVASSEETASTASAEKTETMEKAKTASETVSQIRTIISTEIANVAQNGVKTAGLNLLV